jgi:DNA ligase-associated metallophosphoesterase
MTAYHALEFAGETLWLLPEKAVYWPSRQALFLADLHLGKGAVFRHHGIPVPAGSTQAALARIDDLLSRYAIETVYILGDLFHNPRLAPARLKSQLLLWRSSRPGLRCFLIPGNHDKAIITIAYELTIDLLVEPYRLAPFHLVHNVDDFTLDFRIGGHIHPVYCLKHGYRQKIRLPCFCVNSVQLILPAFGDFTGGFAIEKKQDQTVIICCENNVFEL